MAGTKRFDFNLSDETGKLVDTSGKRLRPDDTIEVFHYTDRETAARFAREGIHPGRKTQRKPSISKTWDRPGQPVKFEPGHGLSKQGTYVLPKLDQQWGRIYGDSVLGIKVKIRDLGIPGETTAITGEEALLNSNGLIMKRILPEDIRIIGR
jgi:hypothetical protein